jgi:hypothetical protein
MLGKNRSAMGKDKLFMGFKKHYDSFVKEELYGIITETGTTMKLVKLFTMLLLPDILAFPVVR